MDIQKFLSTVQYVPIVVTWEDRNQLGRRRASRCTRDAILLLERPSGGNRWYSSKSDKQLSFTILQKPLRVYSRHETYPYLGHKFNVAGN